MANYVASFAVHATTGAGVVDTITLTGNSAEVVQVKVRSGADALWYTKDGSTPVVGAVDTYVALPGEKDFISARADKDTIKVLSPGIVQYSVVGDHKL